MSDPRTYPKRITPRQQLPKLKPQLTATQIRAGIDPHAEGVERDVTEQFGEKVEKRRAKEAQDLNPLYLETLQRRAIKKSGAAEFDKQNRLLRELNSNLGANYTYKSLFNEIPKNEALKENDFVKEISRIQAKKDYGHLVDLDRAPEALLALRGGEEALERLLEITPQEGQKTYKIRGEITSPDGTVEVFEKDRIISGDELDIQRRKRKAAATRKTGDAEGVLLGIDLGDGLLNAFLDKKTDAVNIPLYKTASGEHAFDVAKAKKRLTDYYYHIKLIEAGHTAEAPLNPDVRRKIYDSASKRSDTEMSAIMQKGTGVFFVDRDPEGKTQEIINNPWGIRDWHPLSLVPGGADVLARIYSPIRATLAGVQPMDAYYNQARTTLEDQGLLEYMGNVALSTSVGSAIHAGGWGTPEHVKMIRRGYDITDDYGNIAQILTPKSLEKTWMTHVPGVAAMIGLILVDPDPTLLLGPIGKGGKATMKALGLSGAALQASRLGTQQKLLKELMEMTPEALSAGGFKKWSDKVKYEDQDLYHNFMNQMKAREGVVISADVAAIENRYEKNLRNVLKEVRNTEADLNQARALMAGAQKTKKVAEIEKRKKDLLFRAAQINLIKNRDALIQSYSSLPFGLSGVFGKQVGARRTFNSFFGTPLKSRSYKKAIDALADRYAKGLAKNQKDLVRYKAARKALERDQKDFVEGTINTGGAFVREIQGGSAADVAYYKSKLGKSVNEVTDALLRTSDQDFLNMMSKAKRFSDLPEELRRPLQDMFLSQGDAMLYLKRRASLIRGKEQIARKTEDVIKGQAGKKHLDLLAAEKKARRGLLDAGTNKGLAANELAAMESHLFKTATRLTKQNDMLSAVKARAKIAEHGLGHMALGLADEFVRSIDLVKDRLMSVQADGSKINPLRSKGVLKKTSAGLVLNSPLLLSKMHEKFGKEVVDRFFEEIGEKTTVATQQFADLARGQQKVLTPDDVRLLTKGLNELEIRSTQLLPKAEMIGQSLLNDIKSIHRTGVSTRDFRRLFNKDHRFRSWVFDLQSELAKMGWKLDAFIKGVSQQESAAGMSERILSAYQRGIEVFTAVNQEIAFLTKGLRGAELQKVMNEYLNGTSSMKVKGGNFVGTIMNVGPISMAQIAFKQILSNPDINKYAQDFAANVDAKFLDIDSIPKTLMILSRVWLPPAVKVEDSQALELAKSAVQLIINQINSNRVDLPLFMQQLKTRTNKIIENVASEPPDKAWHWLSQGINNGVMMDASGRVAINVFGSMSDETADVINRAIAGTFGRGDGKITGEQFKDAFGKLAELGLPSLSRKIKDGEIGELSNQLVKISEDANGMGAYVPQALVEKLNGALKGVIKDLEVQQSKNPDGPTQIALSLMSTLFGLFRASITTGLFLPNPRYWLNNIAGDFSQIWKEEGLGTAAKLSFQNLPPNLPFIGRPLHNHMMKMAEWADGKPILSNVTNALVNPGLNKIWNGGADEIIVMKSGVPYVVGDVRRMMAEDGILDTFVQATLLDALRKEHQDQWRLIPKAWKEALNKKDKSLPSRGVQKLEDVNEAIQKHATFVQQRQRAGLYMEVLSRGGTREEAREAVMGALYNWKAPMSQREITYLTKMFTFYRFQKLASQQFIRNVVLAARGDRRGARAVSRLREMEQSLDVIPAAAYHAEGKGEEGQAKTFEEAIDAMYRDIPFWWQGVRPVAYSTPITNSAVQKYYKDRGFEYTYQDILLPPFTPLDMANQWIGASAALMSIMGPVLPGEGVPTTDVTSKLLVEPITAAMSPGLSTGVELALKSFMGGTQYVGGGRSYLRPGEDEFFPLMGMEGLIRRDDSGRAYVEGNGRSFLMLFRSTPFLGTQASQYYTAADNPYWKSSHAEGTAYLLGKLLGVAPRPKDPERELGFSVKERKAETQKLVRSAEARLAQKTANK